MNNEWDEEFAKIAFTFNSPDDFVRNVIEEFESTGKFRQLPIKPNYIGRLIIHLHLNGDRGIFDETLHKYARLK